MISADLIIIISSNMSSRYILEKKRYLYLQRRIRKDRVIKFFW